MALTYWVPAVDGASTGPDRPISGVELSMLMVFVGVAETPAAFVANSSNLACPTPTPWEAEIVLVSNVTGSEVSEHCCQVWRSGT